MKRIFKIISISVAAAVVVLTGWFFLKKQPVYDNYDEIQLFKVKRENLDNSIYISAIVVSDESEYVYSYVDAPVADVKVNKGDTVKKGDVICIFDCSELQTEYDNYKAILDHLENIDNIYSDTFNENSAIERNILESQIAQVKKLIENYQKKYDEVFENIVEKMVAGRIKKYYKEVCLMDQPGVKDSDKNIAKFVDEKSKELGSPIVVNRFVRFERGEGIEKEEVDFATEVANQVKGK